MASQLTIQDGSPHVWNSQSIVPSTDTVPLVGDPTLTSTITTTSTDVSVFVKVENTGTTDIGACPCALAQWLAPNDFTGFGAGLAPPASVSGGFTFTAGSRVQGPNTILSDTLTGPAGFSPLTLEYFGPATAPLRAWDWSPDGNFFALAASNDGLAWHMWVVALVDLTLPNGTSILKGAFLNDPSSVAGTFTSPFSNAAGQMYFSWVKSLAIVAMGPSGAGLHATVVCSMPSTMSNVWQSDLLIGGNLTGWLCVASPCGASVAFEPQYVLNGALNVDFIFLSTSLAAVHVTQNGASVAAGALKGIGPNPKVTTLTHGALGVRVDQGNGVSLVDVDDPECTLVGGNVLVRVDRVKASTLPNANLGVLPVGSAALGLLVKTDHAWVQVPNPTGWDNQGEPHWCLLAQAYTTDPLIIPSPWNGVDPFDVTQVNLAQRNIMINT